MAERVIERSEKGYLIKVQPKVSVMRIVFASRMGRIVRLRSVDAILVPPNI